MDVVVNAAMSADGKLSTPQREQITMSGADDFRRVDELRARSDAVMVGVETVLADDPSLTVSEESLLDAPDDDAQPARVIADSRLRTPVSATVFDDRAHTYLLTSSSATPDDRVTATENGASVIVAGDDRVDLKKALAELERAGISSLMVEGGGELIAGLLATDLVDELRVYVAPLVIGGRDSPTLVDGPGFDAPYVQLTLDDVKRLDDGVVLSYSVDS